MTVQKLRPAERRNRLLEVVLSGNGRVEELSNIFNVSDATIRRDLAVLSKERRLVRTYGGASGVGALHEPELSLEQRMRKHQSEKEAIARHAAQYVNDGDTVFLDGGTTTAALARRLRERRNLVVFTNNLLVVSHLAHCDGIRLMLLGGELRSSSMSTYGALAQLALARHTVDKAFLGADGVVAQLGLCEASADQSYLKECVIHRAGRVLVLADSEKLGRMGQQNWAPIETPWILITDGGASPSDLAPFRETGNVEVHLAKPAAR